MADPKEAFSGPGRGVHRMSMATSEDQRRPTLGNWILTYERGLAGACATIPPTAPCQVDAEAAGTRLSEVSLMHVGHGPASLFMAMPDDETVALFGEVDISNDDQMTEALRLTAGRADAFMKVDLSGLTLLSAAGCRAMIEGTDGYRARGGRVLLVGARPPVQRVLKLLGFDRAPGFAMAKDSA